MRGWIITAALGLAACNSGPDITIPETQQLAEAAFAPDDIYGVRHRASGAVCPGTIDGVARVRASIVAEAARYDWCQYTARSAAQTYDIFIERKPGESADAGLAALKAARLEAPDTWTETASDFPDRQARGFTWTKAGNPSRAVWLTRAGEWRIVLAATYPEAQRAQTLAAASDYFRKLRAR